MCSVGRGCTALCAYVCLWTRAYEMAQVGGIHVTHSEERGYGLRVTCTFCVAVRRERGRYDMSRLSVHMPDDAFASAFLMSNMQFNKS